VRTVLYLLVSENTYISIGVFGPVV